MDEIAHTPASVDQRGADALYASQARLNVVLVHGFMGDVDATWIWQEPGFRLMRRTTGVPLANLMQEHCSVRCNYFSLSHGAGVTSATDIERAAGLLRNFIQTRVRSVSHAPVVLVAHSFGGLACRQAILDMLEYDRDPPVVGLLMLGTPNSGAEIARLPGLAGSRSAKDMMPFNDVLSGLNREWTRRVVNGGDPDLDPARRMPILCWAVVGTEDRIVSLASGSSLSSFAEVHHIRKSHVGLPKAKDRHDPTFLTIDAFISKCEEFSRSLEKEAAIRTLTYRLRAASNEQPSVGHESVKITLGDAVEGHRYTCTIVEKRMRGTLEGNFTVCATCPGQTPAIKLEFEWEIGPGIMDLRAFDAMLQRQNAELDAHFSIIRIEATQAGKCHALREGGRNSGPGWHTWTYDVPPGFNPREPYESLEIEVRTVADRRQGWMFYPVARTVTESLDVCFCAPFSFAPLVRLGRGATIHPVISTGGSFVSRVTVPGPVAIGRHVTWIYGAGIPHEQN